MKRAAHRPRRKYPSAPIHRTEVPLDACPFCDAPLVDAGWREVNKYVQLLNGPVHVIGRGKKCSNEDCPAPQARYHSTPGDKLSLPYCTYGLDVLAYIAHRRNGEHKQFVEIWQELQTKYEVEISERQVGLLYRKVQALLMGNQAEVWQELAATEEKYGKLIMAVDALQPDGGGPKMYILHELLGGTIISLATLDQAKEDNLIEWLEPYREWRGSVEGTISDNEKALVAALKKTFPEAKHQLCQMHFVKDLSSPVHEADRELQKELREGMGTLPPVDPPERERKAEEETENDDGENEEDGEKRAQVSPALMWAIDTISGVDADTLDTLSPQEWEQWWRQEGSEKGAETEESTSYLSAAETEAWVTSTLMSQVPMSARPLVEEEPEQDTVTYWEHMRYRKAIQDARHLGRRKPFRCGGLRGYEQLQAIATHFAVLQREQGLDPYLSQLQICVQQALERAQPLAEDVREARNWIVEVERLLADEPVVEEGRSPSTIQRQRMEELFAECNEQEAVGPTVKSLLGTWRRMLDTWGPDLYHCYNIESLPRSNLGVEALFGQARRQQRRLCGKADTSSLGVTGQGYLRATDVGQEALLEIFQQVPGWVYRLAHHCVDAIEAGIRWPRQLHRDPAKALQRLRTQADALHQRALPP